MRERERQEKKSVNSETIVIMGLIRKFSKRVTRHSLTVLEFGIQLKLN